MIVQQRYPQDCGVACIAMFTGKDYDSISDTIYNILKKKFTTSGMTIEHIAAVLYRGFGTEPLVLRTLVPKVPAIVTVPSIGTPKAFHYIFFDGKDFYDPSRSISYTNKDFKDSFPVADAIVLKDDFEREIALIKDFMPSHLVSSFDWHYILKEVIK